MLFIGWGHSLEIKILLLASFSVYSSRREFASIVVKLVKKIAFYMVVVNTVPSKYGDKVEYIMEYSFQWKMLLKFDMKNVISTKL